MMNCNNWGGNECWWIIIIFAIILIWLCCGNGNGIVGDMGGGCGCGCGSNGRDDYCGCCR